jgi:MFS family permease
MRGETPARPRVKRPVGLSNPAPIYAVGLFGMGYTDFYIFLIPLYGLSLGMNASQVGMLVGGRSLLAVFLSIHIGVLMDRFGTRRVTLFFVWSAIALAPVFPLLPWFWPLLLLQIVNGGALSFAWSGAQTLIAQLAEGEAEYIGRRPDPGGRRLGFWRCLAELCDWRAVGRDIDNRAVAGARGQDADADTVAGVSPA